LAQFVIAMTAGKRRLAEALLKQTVAFAALPLGAVKREVGIGENLFGASPVAGADGEADAESEERVLVLPVEG